MDEACAIANRIAPEHLEILAVDGQRWVESIRHAGAVFCGPYAPASMGDYVAGPSHVLPTDGTARFGSALTIDDFCKRMHVVTVSERAFGRLAPAVATLASAEGFDCHAESVRLRRSGGEP